MSELAYADLGRAPYGPVLDLQERLVEQVRADGKRAFLLTVEHDPPVITMGRRAQVEHVVASPEALAAGGIEIVKVRRGGDVTWHGPGQLVAYPILRLDRRRWTLREYVHRLEQAVIDTLGRLGVEAGRREGLIGAWAGERKIAAIGVAVSRWVTYHGLALNVAPDTGGFDAIVPCGIRDVSITSVSKLLGREVTVEEVKPGLVESLARNLDFGQAHAGRTTEDEDEHENEDEGCRRVGTSGHSRTMLSCEALRSLGEGGRPVRFSGQARNHGQALGAWNAHAAQPREQDTPSPALPLTSDGSTNAKHLPEDNPQSAIRNSQSTRPRLPRWLRRPIPAGPHLAEVRRLLSDLGLHTVCSSARCPNQAECFAKRTATFMILGENCTRNCRFCAVPHGTPEPVDESEANKVARAAGTLGLRHVVITSVTRDDLPDGGAGHFAAVTRAVRARLPQSVIEILIPDFQGSEPALATALSGGCDILNHNVETVPRLYPTVRPQANYRQSLSVLEAAKRLGRANNHAEKLYTKSGLMVGLGETRDELLAALADLRSVGCDILTVGQYLAPSPEHHPVVRFVPPAEFDELRAAALEMGFAAVAAGPFVRSSYQAQEVFEGRKRPNAGAAKTTE